MNKLTLKEVAKRLNVSTATVSNAFKRPSQLSQALREHILSECAEMGYLGPKALARHLKTTKTHVIGVMVSHELSYSFADPIANHMLQGLAQVFEPYQYNLLLMPARHDAKSQDNIETFVERFIVYGPPAEARLQRLLTHKKAIVGIDFHHPELVSVNIDNYQAAKQIADHALLHQPTRIGIVALRCGAGPACAPLDTLTAYGQHNIMCQRLSGFMDSAAQAGYSVASDAIININDNTRELGYQAARQLLSQPSPPPLILCMSDQSALGACQAVTDMQLAVPIDVQVTGFDGIDLSEPALPSLTTVRQPDLDKGRAAAEIFVGLRPEQDELLEAAFYIGQSCP